MFKFRMSFKPEVKKRLTKNVNEAIKEPNQNLFIRPVSDSNQFHLWPMHKALQLSTVPYRSKDCGFHVETQRIDPLLGIFKARLTSRRSCEPNQMRHLIWLTCPKMVF